jgi:uncharacterized protein YerC
MNSSEIQLEKIQKLLETCYRELPDQFVLQEVKSNLRKTIESVNLVKKKRTKRKIQEQQNVANKLQFLSYQDAKSALAILDQMMQDEQRIIDSANTPAPKNTISNMPNDDMLLG